MNRLSVTKLLLFILLAFGSLHAIAQPPKKTGHGQVKNIYRGFEITADLTEKDFVDLKKYGVNLVRVMFADNKLISKALPYEYNETEFKKLDNIIMLCHKYGIRVVIDPHTFPGLKNDYTTSYDDEFWKRKDLQDKLVEMWKKISDRYKANGKVIFGYDLLNEPYVPDSEIWYDLVARIIKVIRNNGDDHTIIIEPNDLNENGRWISRNKHLARFKLPDDDNIMVSPHFYEPHEYTHQLVSPSYGRISYSNPKLNAKAIVQKEISLIREFQLAHPKVPVYIGEFSVSRIAGDSNEYLKDVIDACEKYGWHWTYHAFRESFYWDPEMPVGTLEILPRNNNEKRITLLKSYFLKNKQAEF